MGAKPGGTWDQKGTMAVVTVRLDLAEAKLLERIVVQWRDERLAASQYSNKELTAEERREAGTDAGRADALLRELS